MLAPRSSTFRRQRAPGQAARVARCIFGASCRGHRGFDCRRIHLRARCARLARSAGPHSSIRRDRNRAGWRGQRCKQRRRIGRPRTPDWSCWKGRGRGNECEPRLQGVDTKALLRPDGYCTPVKTRILAGGVHTAKQQIVRIDRVVSSELDARRPKRVRSCVPLEGGGRLRGNAPVGLWDRSRDPGACARPEPESGKAFAPAAGTVLCRFPLRRCREYRGLTACTPNESEVEQMFAVKIGDSLKSLERAGRGLLKRTRMNAVVDHPWQPRYGALRSRTSDDSRADLRIR